jgi:hypothetical protein
MHSPEQTGKKGGKTQSKTKKQKVSWLEQVA